MDLIEKLNEVKLSEKERNIAIEKFGATLALIEDIAAKQEFLHSKVIEIDKARELKVLCNSLDELAKKYNILAEIHETLIYQQDPLKLNYNVIDIYKKIKYCIQNNLAYKKADGSYEEFLFNEFLWQQEMNKTNDIPNVNDSLIDNNDIVTVEPVIDINPSLTDFDTLDTLKIDEPIETFEKVAEPSLNEEQLNSDIEDIEARTTTYANLKNDLQQVKDALDNFDLSNQDSFKDSLNDFSDEISFNDIEPESYGMGRAA